MTATTRRRIIFVTAFIIIAIIIIALWLLNVTTPHQCKVPVAQMSQWCLDLVYS